MVKRTKKWNNHLGAKIAVGVMGLISSVMLHELFHIFMHWGEVRHVSIFPSDSALVGIGVWVPPGYDMEGEEIAAYGITLIVILITSMTIAKMNDNYDERSIGQILFPNDEKMQHLSPEEMLRLSGLDEKEYISKKSVASKKKSRK